MAKKNVKVSTKGIFCLETMSITEYDKKTEQETEHCLIDLFADFDGKEVSIALAEDSDI